MHRDLYAEDLSAMVAASSRLNAVFGGLARQVSHQDLYAKDLFAMVGAPSKVGPVSGCIIVSTGFATSSPPGCKTSDLSTVIGKPWTCAPERPVRH